MVLFKLSGFHCCYWEIGCQLNCSFMGDPSILFIFLLCQAVSPCYVWVSVFFIYPAWDVWYLIKWVLISFKNSEKFLAIVFFEIWHSLISHSRNPVKIFLLYSLCLLIYLLFFSFHYLFRSFGSLVFSSSVSNILFHLTHWVIFQIYLVSFECFLYVAQCFIPFLFL